jgi:hypothetical protein
MMKSARCTIVLWPYKWFLLFTFDRLLRQ